MLPLQVLVLTRSATFASFDVKSSLEGSWGTPWAGQGVQGLKIELVASYDVVAVVWLAAVAVVVEAGWGSGRPYSRTCRS